MSTLLARAARNEEVHEIIARMATGWPHYSTDDGKLQQLRHQMDERLAAHDQ